MRPHFPRQRPVTETGPGRTCSLAALQPGERALIAFHSATGSARRRLLDLGLTTGATVGVLRNSPLGDPTAYLIRGATIALRRTDAAGITVIPVGHEPRLKEDEAQ